LAKQKHFWEMEIRPRFSFESDMSLRDFIDSITLAIHKEDAPLRARIVHDHIVLYFPVEQQHYWSPQLSLSIEEEGEGILVRGLYGPRPAVWTMFVFFYAFIGFALLFLLIFGFSYMSMGKSANILWFVPILLIILLSIYRVARQGQKMGKKEMETIHKFLKSALSKESP